MLYRNVTLDLVDFFNVNEQENYTFSLVVTSRLKEQFQLILKSYILLQHLLFISTGNIDVVPKHAVVTGLLQR